MPSITLQLLHEIRCSNHHLLSGLIIKTGYLFDSLQLRHCCLTTGSLQHIIHTHLAVGSQSNDSLRTRSVILLLHTALNPINMPQLHMTASEWKSDIGPANLNYIQSNGTHDSHFQWLSQMYRPESKHEYK